MHSAIYQGRVRHRRFSPTTNRFSYSVFMMYIDLDEVDEVLNSSWFWSSGNWRPARFVRKDYYGDPEEKLVDSIRALVKETTGQVHTGATRMLSNFRYFGFLINPITCYYCFNDDETLKNIVLEVTNTPWKESQTYVLNCDPDRSVQRIEFDKRLHVSPFNPMNMQYLWKSRYPGNQLSFNLDTMKDNEKHMDATLVLDRFEINSLSMALVLIKKPVMTVKVVCAIYWQAIILLIKKTPLYWHPEPMVESKAINVNEKEKMTDS
ncbi:MAG: DUF1365 family protein [Gammaproteobacteria bacterium]|jgi:DUF1365 family protein